MGEALRGGHEMLNHFPTLPLCIFLRGVKFHEIKRPLAKHYHCTAVASHVSPGQGCGPPHLRPCPFIRNIN